MAIVPPDPGAVMIPAPLPPRTRSCPMALSTVSEPEDVVMVPELLNAMFVDAPTVPSIVFPEALKEAALSALVALTVIESLVSDIAPLEEVF